MVLYFIGFADSHFFAIAVGSYAEREMVSAFFLACEKFLGSSGALWNGLRPQDKLGGTDGERKKLHAGCQPHQYA